MTSPTPPLRLGIDVGGSKILALVIDAKGKVVARHKRRTKSELGYKTVLERIADTGLKACATVGVVPGKDIRGVGLGLPGPVDEVAGVLHRAVNLGWDASPVAKHLGKLFDDLPVALGNDVNFGALGEVAHGAGRGAASVFCIFVGTGLGGALVIDGKVVNGRHGLAGEIGHIVTPFGNAPCGCGQEGCIEAYVAKSGLQRQFEKRIKRGETCLIDNTKKLRASELHLAWNEGCATTHAVLERAMAVLAWGVATITATVDPECFIFGGGVMEELADDLLPRISAYYQDYPFVARLAPPRFMRATLGDDAVAIGAAVAGGRLG